MKTIVLKAAALAVAAIVLSVPPATAQEEEGIIKHRQAVMAAIGGHFGAMSRILKGQVKFTGDLKTHARAIADHTEAIRLDPKDAFAYYNRAKSHMDAGDFDRAIADFTEAIRLDPKKSSRAYCNRGSAYEQKGEHNRAIEFFKKSI